MTEQTEPVTIVVGATSEKEEIREVIRELKAILVELIEVLKHA
jgi:hypothetical protein